jgi:hypothetical protein
MFDCSFRWIPNIIGQDLRFRFVHDSHLRSMHSWQIHGPRLLVFLLLSLLAMTFTGVVVGRLLMGSERERSIKCMLLATGLVACWLGLATSWQGLWWLAFRHRIAKHHDAMKAAVTRLSDQWPTSRIDLPGLGGYEMSGHDPNLLYIEGHCPNGLTDFTEAFDRIGKNRNGGFSFAVGSYPGWWVHFSPQNERPQSYTRDVLGTPASWDLQTVVELGDGWYLAYYELTMLEGSVSFSGGG